MAGWPFWYQAMEYAAFNCGWWRGAETGPGLVPIPNHHIHHFLLHEVWGYFISQTEMLEGVCISFCSAIWGMDGAQVGRGRLLPTVGLMSSFEFWQGKKEGRRLPGEIYC